MIDSLPAQVEQLRRWCITNAQTPTAIIDLEWPLVDHMLRLIAERSIYEPKTTETVRRVVLHKARESMPMAEVYGLETILEELAAAEAALAGHYTTRWIRLRKASRTGKILFVCVVCGRVSQTPDKSCPEQYCHEVTL